MRRSTNSITDVWTLEVAAPLKRVLSTAKVHFSESRTLLVVIERADGSFGVGEAGAGHTGQAGKTIPALRSLIEGPYKSMLMGEQLDVNGLRRRLETAFLLEPRGVAAAALSGIDIALWDLFAKDLDRPLCEALGGASRPVNVYASGGQYRDSSEAWSLEEEMLTYVENGFTAVKMKVGRGPIDLDPRRIEGVRCAVGAEVGIAVDATYSLTPKQAIGFSRRVEQFRVDFLEAPVAINDIAGLAEVRQFSPLPIAGNEFVSTYSGFKELIVNRCVDLVQPCLIMCGGVSEAIRITALADAFGLPITLQAAGSMISSLVSLHFASAFPSVHSCEMHQIHGGLASQLCSGPLTVKNGLLEPPAAPGVGVTASLAELRQLQTV